MSERYHHGDLRRALIDAAVALIGEAGAEALTLRAVARRAGVSHAAPYRHFADRGALVAAVAEEGFDALHAVLREAAAREADAMERLVAPGLAYLRFASAHPAHYRVMFGPEVAAALTAGTEPAASLAAFQFLLDEVSRARDAGLLEVSDVFVAALGMWALAHGASMLVVDGLIAAEAIDTVGDALIRQHLVGLVRAG